MSGPDLKADYGLLNSSERRLRQMKSFFDGIKDWDRSCASFWGASAIASAISGHFAGNWDIHRKRLMESMDSLAELCDMSVKEFQKADAALARSVTGQVR